MRNLCTELGELGGITKEIDDLTQLFLFFVCTGNIREKNLLLFIGTELCACFAKAGDIVSAAALAVCLVHDINPHHNKEDDDKRIGKQRQPPRIRRRRVNIVIGNDAFQILLFGNFREVPFIRLVTAQRIGNHGLIFESQMQFVVSGQNKRVDLFFNE